MCIFWRVELHWISALPLLCKMVLHIQMSWGFWDVGVAAVVWCLDLAPVAPLSKPRHVTALSLYQLLIFLRVWWRITVGGGDRSPEGTGRGEEETDHYIEEQTLAHEEETHTAQVKTKSKTVANLNSHPLTVFGCCCCCILFFMLVLFWYFACYSFIFFTFLDAYHHSCHVHVMLIMHY